MKENKKNKNEKRILIGALCIAAVVAAGSTFAWFTSQDEVTNRLTASANYGVSITEDFTPPTDWIPGQTINKDVKAVNTGSVSAFVKLQLEGAFNLTVETAAGESTNSTISYYQGTNTAEANGNKLDVLTEDEVKSLQAGGYLAYAPSGVDTGIVGTDFEVSNPGLYLFRREIKIGETTTYDYSGYYYSNLGCYLGLKTVIGTDGELTVDALRDKGATLTTDDIASVMLKSYESKTIAANDSQLTWNYSDVNNKLVTVTYHPTGVDGTNKDIKINIALDNIGNGTEADTWQFVNDAFYYTDDVEPGETTNKLVDSVTLDEATRQEAFYTMDFDLTIKLDSVQVTRSEAGVETADAADQIGTVNGDPTVDGNEITVIGWK